MGSSSQARMASAELAESLLQVFGVLWLTSTLRTVPGGAYLGRQFTLVRTVWTGPAVQHKLLKSPGLPHFAAVRHSSRCELSAVSGQWSGSKDRRGRRLRAASVVCCRP